MLASKKRLKDTYKVKLWVFIALNVAIYWGLLAAGAFYGSETDELLKNLLSPKAMLLPLLPVLTTALSGLLPQSVKEFIVFFRIKNRLPGCRAFTMWAQKDHRINPKMLKEKYGDLPVEPHEQNRLWYSIYKSHENATIVATSHKDFLMLRDFAAVAVIFLFAGGFSIWFVCCAMTTKWIYIAFLSVQSLILQLAARNHGIRFVTNVLAVDTVRR